MSVNTFSKRTEIDLRSIQLRSILVWTAPKVDLKLDTTVAQGGWNLTPCPHVSVFVWKRNLSYPFFRNKSTSTRDRTGKRRFRKVPLWRPSSKSAVFGDRFIVYVSGRKAIPSKKSCVFKKIRTDVWTWPHLTGLTHFPCEHGMNAWLACIHAWGCLYAILNRSGSRIFFKEGVDTSRI